MEAFTTALIGLGIGSALGLGVRFVGAWERRERARLQHESELARFKFEGETELAKLKSGWYAQMQRAQKRAPSKKKDDDADDDDLVRAMRHPLVRGFLDGQGIDVEALEAGDRKEWSKLKKLGGKLGNSGEGWELTPEQLAARG